MLGPTPLLPLRWSPEPCPPQPYGHFAFVERVQEEGHAVRAQMAVLAGEVVCHLQQLLLLERVALVGKGQLGDVNSVLGNVPVPTRRVALTSPREARPGTQGTLDPP